jgi:3-hydroxyacyl-[acyl-carrier-protein] dehydratase
MLDIEEIRRLLPLRYPYLMIDRVIVRTEDRVIALKNVTVNEPVFQGHFPEPLGAILPGTLILEAMAQSASLLVSTESGSLQEGYLVGVGKARFRRKVVPGDQLRIEARRTRLKRGLLQADVEARVDDEMAASAVISLFLPGMSEDLKGTE